MHRRIASCLVLLATCALLAAPAARAEPPEVAPEARAVLEKAMESMGGEEALAAVQALRQEVSGSYASPSMPTPMPYTAVTTFVWPGRMLWELDTGMFKASMGMDADVAWSQFMAPPARVKGYMLDQMQMWRVSYDLLLVRPLLHREGWKITGGGTVEREGRTLHVVHAELPNGFRYELSFGGEDGTFLVHFEGDMVHMDGQPGRMVADLSQPRAFGDVTVPTLVSTRTFAGDEPRETMQETTVEIEWNPEVTDEMFEMPEVDMAFGEVAVGEATTQQGVMLVHEGPFEGLGATVKRLMAACQEAGLFPMGAVTAIFVTDPDEVEDPADLRAEVFAPVMFMGPPPSELPGGLSMKTLEGGPIAGAKARGPYGEADVVVLEAVMAWIEENGYEVTGPPRILYFHDPDATVAEDAISEVQVPVRRSE